MTKTKVKTMAATITARPRGTDDIVCGLWGCKAIVRFDVVLDMGLGGFRSCPACLGKMIDFKFTWSWGNR